MFGRLAESNAMAQIMYGLALRLVSPYSFPRNMEGTPSFDARNAVMDGASPQILP